MNYIYIIISIVSVSCITAYAIFWYKSFKDNTLFNNKLNRLVAYKEGYDEGRNTKIKIHMQMEQNELMIDILHDRVGSNVFSAENRRN